MIKKKMIVILFILLSVSGGGMAENLYAAISLTEREALTDLYNSTNGDYWKNNTGWKEPPLHSDGFAMPGTECQWRGVLCNYENNHVEEINLSNNELSGNIPASIKNLSYLISLYLSSNFFTTIPQEIGELLNLQYLYLESSHLTGPVPATLLNLINLVDGGSDFRNNSLCTSDPELLDFLNRKQFGGNWESEQQSNISTAIIILQIIAGFHKEGLTCDVNADNRIGLEEAIYILQKISKLR